MSDSETAPVFGECLICERATVDGHCAFCGFNESDVPEAEAEADPVPGPNPAPPPPEAPDDQP